MTPPAHLLGVVLAGGESRRFGSPKALAPFRGEPMVLRAVRTLDRVCARVVVVGQAEGLGGDGPFELVPDRLPGKGPLGGLDTALRTLRELVDDGADDHGRPPGLLLLGCDMPLVDPALVRAVGRVGVASGAPAAAPLGERNRLEPLCAWYDLTCLPEVESRIRGADRSLHGLLRAVDAYGIPPAVLGPGVNPAWALRSANTPEALVRLEEEAVQAEARVAHPAAGADRGKPPTPPPAFCVVGYKDSGKTGVSVALAAELRRRGYRVAAVKHGHGFRLDEPGTDSWRLRHEGTADPVLLTGPEGFALMGSWEGRGEPGIEAHLRTHLEGAELVLVEGFKTSSLPKIEVFRRARHPAPFFRSGDSGAEGIVAVVTDHPTLAAPVPVLRLDDPELASRLADLVEDRVLRSGTRRREEHSLNTDVEVDT